MNRRHMLGTLTAGVASLGFVEGRTFAAEKDDRQEASSSHAKMMQKCLEACTNCMNQCNMTAHYAYEKSVQGSTKFLDALHVTVDCQEFCGLSAKMIGRASPLMVASCKACGDACEMCAKECEKHEADEQLARCAKECRECVKTCHDMVAHMAH